MKIIKKLLALTLCVVITAAFSSCSNNGKYVMTEEDLALQDSLLGFWMPGAETGANTVDEEGNLKKLIIVEFTDDFCYLFYEYYVDTGLLATYDPVYYTIEDMKFRVDLEGVPSYASITVSEDGNTMYWITDDKTDRYVRVSESDIRELGIPEYKGKDDTAQDTGSEESSPESSAADTTGSAGDTE